MSGFGKTKTLAPLIPLVLLIGLWEWIGSMSSRNFFLYGTPSAVIVTLRTELGRAGFWFDIAVTSSEVIGGLCVGNLLGTAIALGLWLYPFAARMFHPYVVAFASIPVFAVMPLFILWFGVGFVGKLAVIVFSTAFVSLAYGFAAALASERTYEEVIRCMGGARRDLLRRAIIPAVIARSFLAYRMNVGFALVGAYVAEWVSATHGLGQFILRATSLYDVPRVWAGLIVFLTLAFVLYALTTTIERRLVPHATHVR